MRIRLKHKISIFFAAVLLAVAALVFAIVQVVSTTLIRKGINNNIYSRQEYMDTVVVSVFDELMFLYSRIMFDNTINSLISEDIPAADKQAQYLNMMSNVGVNSGIIFTIVCYIGDEIFVTTDVPLPDEDFLSVLSNSESQVEIGSLVSGLNCLQIGKRMVNYPFINAIGAIIFYVHTEALSDICRILDSSIGETFITDNKTTVVAHSNNKNSGAAILDSGLYFADKLPSYRISGDRQKSIIAATELTELNRCYNINWQAVTIVSYDALFSGLKYLKYYIFGFSGITLVIALLIALRLSNKMVKPIVSLTERVHEFSETGKKSISKAISEDDELYRLEKSYEEMTDKILIMIDKIKQDMETQRKIELDSLQMQINPHFLYNVLDAIAWLAKLKKEEQIEKLSLALARFFRITLHNGDKYISVSEEIELIRNFMQIEIIRFPDKFEIEYETDDSIKDEMMLKLILQPIVENAVKHGVGQSANLGKIKICAYSDGDDLVFEVIDNGKGFGDADLENGGYGLKNVSERIRLAYGGDYNISIDRQYKHGAKVVVRIPKIRAIDSRTNEIQQKC